MRCRIVSLSVLALLVVIGTTSAGARGKKSVQIQPLPADQKVQSLAVLASLPGEAEALSKTIFLRAFSDRENVYMVFTLDKPELRTAVRHIGMTFWFEDRQRGEYGIELRASAPGPWQLSTRSVFGGLFSLLPDSLRTEFSERSADQYQARFVLANGANINRLPMPDFDLGFADSSTFVVKLPFASVAFANERFPFDAEGETTIDLEFGDETLAKRPYLAPMLMNGGERAGGMGRDGRRQRGSSSFDLDYEKIEVSFTLPEWPQLASTLSTTGQFDLLSFITVLDDWTIGSAKRSRSGGMGGPPGGGGMGMGTQSQRRAGGGPFPLTVQALVCGPPVIDGVISYLASLFALSPPEQNQLREKIQREWQTSAYLPMLVSFSSTEHESFLDLQRWAIFLEDRNENQYEQLRIIELHDRMDRRPEFPDNDRQSREMSEMGGPPGGRGMGGIFAGRSMLAKQVVMLFPRRDVDGKLWYDAVGDKIKLIFVLEDHPEERDEMEWKIPQ